MPEYRPRPGISRDARIDDEGLARLEKQLSSGTRMTDQVLAQWIRRYGEPARKIIRQHGRDQAAFDDLF